MARLTNHTDDTTAREAPAMRIFRTPAEARTAATHYAWGRQDQAAEHINEREANAPDAGTEQAEGRRTVALMTVRDFDAADAFGRAYGAAWRAYRQTGVAASLPPLRDAYPSFLAIGHVYGEGNCRRCGLFAAATPDATEHEHDDLNTETPRCPRCTAAIHAPTRRTATAPQSLRPREEAR